MPPGLLGAGQVAADLVYAPRPTPWLAEAAAAGATVLDGLGMLVHQAAAQLALWTGLEPPVEAMWRAAEAASPGSMSRGSSPGAFVALGVAAETRSEGIGGFRSSASMMP